MTISTASSHKNLIEMLENSRQRYGERPLYGTKRDGVYEWTTYEQFAEKVDALRGGLASLGVSSGDKVAIICKNTEEWAVSAYATYGLNGQHIPMYETQVAKEWEYIIRDCGAKVLLAANTTVFEQTRKFPDQIETLEHVVLLSGSADGDETTYEDLLKKGRENPVDVMQPESQSPMGMIYTSGTTGRPKGVMLSHDNIVSNVIESEKRVPFDHGNSKALSFLPVCHVFERMILYLYQYCGVEIYFAESIEKMSDNLKEIKPNVMTAVPRLYEKVYDKIVAKGSDLKGIKKLLFFWAVNLGLKYEPYGQNGWLYEQQLSLARKLIFSKWKEGLGGNLDLMVSGSAALQTRLTRVFAAAEMPIMEGYGLTETSPVVSVNDMRNKHFRIGSVGKIIKDTEVKIAADGEILVKGPQVMMGYYKEEELTNKVIKNDFFHTGDIGEIKNLLFHSKTVTNLL